MDEPTLEKLAAELDGHRQGQDLSDEVLDALRARIQHEQRSNAITWLKAQSWENLRGRVQERKEEIEDEYTDDPVEHGWLGALDWMMQTMDEAGGGT